MKLLKRMVIGIVVLAAITVALAVLVLPSYLNGIVEQGIETYGPLVTGTPVTVEAVRLSPFSGMGRITSLVVANPEGFHTDGALKLGEAKIKLQPGTLLKDVVEIDDITIDGAELTFELGVKGSNLGAIQKHIQEMSAGGGGGGGIKVVVSHFLLKNCTVRVGTGLLKGKVKTVELPTVELRDVGRKSAGITAAEAMGQILGKVVARAGQAVAGVGVSIPDLKQIKAGDLGNNLRQGIKDKLKAPLGKLKSLFGK